MFVRKRDGTPLPSFYKSNVAGDQIRFQSDVSGRIYIFEFASAANPVDRAARGITDPVPPIANTIDVALPFVYFVGLKQIQLWKVDPATGVCTRLLRRSDYPTPGAVNAGALVYASLGVGAVTFDELSSNQIRIYNAFPGDIFMVGYGHTAAPASLGQKIFIENQADQIALEMGGPGDGLVFRTPNGKRVRLSIHDGNGTRVDEI